MTGHTVKSFCELCSRTSYPFFTRDIAALLRGRNIHTEKLKCTHVTSEVCTDLILRDEVFRVVTLSSKVTESECSFKTSSINNAVTQHSGPGDLNPVLILILIIIAIIIIIMTVSSPYNRPHRPRDGVEV
jgi:hypothetical protein